MLIDGLKFAPASIPFLFESFLEFEIFRVYVPLLRLLVRVGRVSGGFKEEHLLESFQGSSSGRLEI